MIGFGVLEVHYNEAFSARIAHMARVRDACLEVAEDAAEYAREIAPYDTGDYVAGITAEKTEAGARVIASDPISAIIEFGAPGRNLPARWILRTAASMAGLKFKKGGK